jgi:DNA-binding transcriptional MocR family regulator
MELYQTAIRHKISFSPGNMFTLKKQFSNNMRLSYGLEWNEKTEQALKLLGKLTKMAVD